MPGSSHHRSSSRKKRHKRSLFERLFGINRRKTHLTSFPGINLPKGYDPALGMKQADDTPEQGQDGQQETVLSPEPPDAATAWLDAARKKERMAGSDRKKPSFSESVRLFFRKRALRREERIMQRMKKKMRKKQMKEFRDQERGSPLRKKLLSFTEEADPSGKDKKIPSFSQKSPFYRNLTIVVNSLSIFIASYVLVYLFYWLTSMMVASLYGLDSTLYYYDLKFNDHSNLWSRFNILLVTGIPPFFCLFLGLFLYRVIFKLKRFTGLQKLFILWTSFHLFNHFFGAFPSGIVTSEGFGYVAAWMYMNTAFKFMFSILSLFVLGLIGYHSAEHILETSDSLHRIKPENKTAFMLIQLALPWFIGTTIMLLTRLPEGFQYPYETLMFFSMVFLVIPPFFNAKVKPKLNLLRVKKKRNINLGYLFMMLALLAFLRLMLGIGLHFIIKIDISISPANL